LFCAVEDSGRARIFPSRAVSLPEHMSELMQGDVGGMERRGPGFVVDVAGVPGADPHAAEPSWPEAGRARPDRVLPLALEPGRELSRVERGWRLKVPEDGGMPSSRMGAALLR
jgi:hypothetical protein